MGRGGEGGRERESGREGGREKGEEREGGVGRRGEERREKTRTIPSLK